MALSYFQEYFTYCKPSLIQYINCQRYANYHLPVILELTL